MVAHAWHSVALIFVVVCSTVLLASAGKKRSPEDPPKFTWKDRKYDQPERGKDIVRQEAEEEEDFKSLYVAERDATEAAIKTQRRQLDSDWLESQQHEFTNVLETKRALLEEGHTHGQNDSATTALAQLYLFGGLEQDIDLEKALMYVQEAASSGNPTAQALLGFMYATGTGVPKDEIRALIYYSFAANAKDPIGLMALGYRFTHGRSVTQSCATACKLYKILSEIVAKKAEERGIMIATAPDSDYLKLAEEVEWTSGVGYTEREIIQYYGFLADTGDLHALVTLGTLHLVGRFGVAQDYQEAFDCFNTAAEFGEPEGFTGLGKLYENGWGVPVDKTIAVKYYNMAVEAGDPGSMTRLGVMHLKGSYLPKNFEKAFEYLDRAAKLGEPEAHIVLGKMYKEGNGVTADIGKAIGHLSAPARLNMPIAMHELAELYRNNVTGGCYNALHLYKKVAQFGAWGENILWEAEDLFFEGRYANALALYKLAAEMGYEAAQANVAWMYEHGFDESILINQEEALKYYFLSAQQSSTGGVASRISIGDEMYLAYSHVRIGDHFYYGLGVQQDYEIAAKFYLAAANKENPEALFNLGYMYHTGIGIPKDFPLAKRYYDMALEHHDTGMAVYPALYWLFAEMAFENTAQYFRNSSASILLASADSILLISMTAFLGVLLVLRIGIARRFQRDAQLHQQQQQPLPNVQ